MKMFLLSILIVVPLIVFQQNCSKVSFSPEKNSASLTPPPDDIKDLGTPDPVQAKACVAPGSGAPIESGKGRIYFETTADGIYCDKVQFRSCNDGELSGSFSKGNCSIVFKVGAQTFRSCSTPIGTIDHGASVMLFSEDAGECSAQLRACDDGILTGPSQFNKISCRSTGLASGAQTCSVNWNGNNVSIPVNSRIMGFAAEKALTEENKSCQLATARCTSTGLVGNTTIVSSCRQKNIDEMPNGTFMVGHVYNAASVFIGYKNSTETQGRACVLEYSKDNSWFAVPATAMSGSMNCSQSVGESQKATVDLRQIANFKWSETVSASGTSYTTQFRLNYNIGIKDSTKAATCLKRSASDPQGTPELDENCDGVF